jgi:hypothetical protein
MNSFNALGFLALGSLMNAVPAIAPSVVAHGPTIAVGLTTSAVWLHFMGIVVGVIGSSTLFQEVLSAHRLAKSVSARTAPQAVPQGAPASAGSMRIAA